MKNMKKLIMAAGIALVIVLAVVGNLNSSGFQSNGTVQTEAELDEYIKTQETYIKHLEFRLQTPMTKSEMKATEALYKARLSELENSLKYKELGYDPSRVLVLSPSN
jgi:hypothetical protein